MYSLELGGIEYHSWVHRATFQLYMELLFALGLISYFVAELWISFSNGLVLQDFFTDVNQNLTKITWVHAVNNQSYLNSTLSDGKFFTLEYFRV